MIFAQFCMICWPRTFFTKMAMNLSVQLERTSLTYPWIQDFPVLTKILQSFGHVIRETEGFQSTEIFSFTNQCLHNYARFFCNYFSQFSTILMVRHYLSYLHFHTLVITPMSTIISGPTVTILVSFPPHFHIPAIHLI